MLQVHCQEPSGLDCSKKSVTTFLTDLRAAVAAVECQILVHDDAMAVALMASESFNYVEAH